MGNHAEEEKEDDNGIPPVYLPERNNISIRDDDNVPKESPRVSRRTRFRAPRAPFSAPSERIALLTETERKDMENWDDLPESIYSIFFVSEVRSASFLFAAFFFIFQTSVASLVLADLIKPRTVNPFNVPPGVTSTVRAGQGLALALAVFVQGDVKQAVQTLQSGYDPSVLKISPSATYTKWLAAYVLQFFVGCMMLIVIFALIVRSSAVIEIFLNFAALAFITEIDDVAFLLAKNGYLTGQIKNVCDTIQEYKTPPESKSYLTRKLVIASLIFNMFGGWTRIIINQNGGRYLCKSLLVQFGDEYIGYLPTFSGSYDIEPGVTRGNRAVYKSRGFDKNQIRFSAFRYCEPSKAWVFGSLLTIDNVSTGINDLCENWLLRTTETETFDLSSIPSTSWMVRRADEDGLTFAVGHLFLECNDCGLSTCKGTCMNNVCVCPPDRFGDRCEFGGPCPKIAFDDRVQPFEALTVQSLIFGEGLSNEYEMLMVNETVPARVYNRPVYVSRASDSTSDLFEAVFFNGRRWLFYENITDSDLAITLAAERSHLFVDAVIPRLFPLFISGPLDLGTPSNSISPAGLTWFARGTDNGQGFDVGPQIESRFVCAVCDDNNVCLNRGICTDGKCHCGSSITGTSGALCERRSTCIELGCQNGGRCNEETGVCDCDPLFVDNFREGFAGNLCQIRVCRGGQVFCFNNGTCDDEANGCTCPMNFRDEHCQTFDCTMSGCQNGGTCIDNGLECDCSTAVGFGGASCEIPLCDDSLNGCFDGKVCDRESGECRSPCCEDPECDPTDCNLDTFQCTCRATGSVCEACQVPFCEVAGCRNGGICDSTLEGCRCPQGFQGSFCENR